MTGPGTALAKLPAQAPQVAALAVGPSRRLVDAFLAGRRATTLRAYRRDLADFAAFCGLPSLAAAAERLLGGGAGAANELVLAYRADLVGRRLSPATINRRLAALRSLVKLGRSLGLIAWALEVASLRSRAYRDTAGPSLEAVAAMLLAAEAHGDGLRPRRDVVILRLLFDLALRRAEAIGLDVGDLDLAHAPPRLAVLGKGRSEKEWLSLPAATAAALAAYLELHPLGADPAGPLLISLDRSRRGLRRLTAEGLYAIVRGYGWAAGVKVRPHGLRHAAITAAIRQAQRHGYELEEVQPYSRHADVRTLLLYRDQLADRQGAIAELVAETVPGGAKALTSKAPASKPKVPKP